MPVRSRVVEPPPEVTAQIDGEGEVDEIIRQRVEDEREGREWGGPPEAFQRHVRQALEYTMEHQRLTDLERCRRRHETDEWFGHLGSRDQWHDLFARRWLEERPQTPQDLLAEAARAEAKKAANERAEALLRNALSSKQLKELDRRGYFHVAVGDRRFRITRGRAGNILEVDARSRILRKLCAHPIDYVPDADTMLAQKLWLEAKPDEFLKMANVTRVRRRPGRLHGEVGHTDTEAQRRAMMQHVAEHLARQALDATAVQQSLARQALDAGVETPTPTTPAVDERAA